MFRMSRIRFSVHPKRVYSEVEVRDLFRTLDTLLPHTHASSCWNGFGPLSSSEGKLKHGMTFDTSVCFQKRPDYTGLHILPAI